MIFSFVRVIESLGHWGVGVNFHGFTQAAGARCSDTEMLKPPEVATEMAAKGRSTC